MSRESSRPVLVGVVWACVWMHLALGVVVLGFLQVVLKDRRNWDGPDRWSGLGLLDRWAVFSLDYIQVYFWALLLGDVAALVLLRRGVAERKRRSLAFCYFIWITLVVVAHLAASVYLNFFAGPIRLPGSTITGGGWSDVVGVGVMDGMFAFPVVLVALALWLMRARPSGLCARCGYELAGVRDGRCPECGEVPVQRS